MRESRSVISYKTTEHRDDGHVNRSPLPTLLLFTTIGMTTMSDDHKCTSSPECFTLAQLKAEQIDPMIGPMSDDELLSFREYITATNSNTLISADGKWPESPTPEQLDTIIHTLFLVAVDEEIKKRGLTYTPGASAIVCTLEQGRTLAVKEVGVMSFALLPLMRNRLTHGNPQLLDLNKPFTVPRNPQEMVEQGKEVQRALLVEAIDNRLVNSPPAGPPN